MKLSIRHLPISKRAWDPFAFLPKQSVPPKGYTELPHETWGKPERHKRIKEQHIPLLEDEAVELQDLVSEIKSIKLDKEEKKDFTNDTFFYLPIKAEKGSVSMGKKIKQYIANINIRLDNILRSKAEMEPDIYKQTLINLKRKRDVLEKLYDRLIAISVPKKKEFKYDETPKHSDFQMDIDVEDARMIDNISKEIGLKSPTAFDEEEGTYVIPDYTLDEHGRKIKITKYLEKLKKAYSKSWIDVLLKQMRHAKEEGVDYYLVPSIFAKKLNSLSEKMALPTIVTFDNQEHYISMYPDTMYREAVSILEKMSQFAQNYFDVLIERYSAAPKSLDWKLVISSEPHDILTMSTNKGWTSCVAKGQCNFSSLDSAVSTYDMVAYAISDKHSNWLARVWLRNDGTNHWWPEKKVYGTGILRKTDFLNAVNKYLQDKNILGKVGQYSPEAKGWSDQLGAHISDVPKPITQEEKEKLEQSRVETPYDKWYEFEGSLKSPTSAKESVDLYQITYQYPEKERIMSYIEARFPEAIYQPELDRYEKFDKVSVFKMPEDYVELFKLIPGVRSVSRFKQIDKKLQGLFTYNKNSLRKDLKAKLIPELFNKIERFINEWGWPQNITTDEKNIVSNIIFNIGQEAKNNFSNSNFEDVSFNFNSESILPPSFRVIFPKSQKPNVVHWAAKNNWDTYAIIDLI